MARRRKQQDDQVMEMRAATTEQQRPAEVQYVALTFADDTLGIMVFVTCEYAPDGTPRWTRLATKENVEDEIARSYFGEGKTPVKRWNFVEPADFPEGRRYRDAWRHTPKKGVHVDMEHAREIHREHLRAARRNVFSQVDAEHIAATAQGDEKRAGEIEARRQVLRDAPADERIEKATTPEQLQKAWPEELPPLYEQAPGWQ